VLTDERFFEGSLDYSGGDPRARRRPAAAQGLSLRALPVYEARAAGADAFLLIAAILRTEIIRELVALGRELEMTALVEVHTREQLERALAAGAPSSASTTATSTPSSRARDRARAARRRAGRTHVVIESGLKTAADLARFEAAACARF
jgi:indole-3-glycerol phosphate synthase